MKVWKKRDFIEGEDEGVKMEGEGQLVDLQKN